MRLMGWVKERRPAHPETSAVSSRPHKTYDVVCAVMHNLSFAAATVDPIQSVRFATLLCVFDKFRLSTIPTSWVHCQPQAPYNGYAGNVVVPASSGLLQVDRGLNSGI